MSNISKVSGNENPLYDALAGFADSDKNLLTLLDDSTLSYKAFFLLAAKMANVLKASGVSPGDRVAMQAGKSYQALALYVACVRAGAVFLPLNSAYTCSEIEYFIDDSQPVVFVCDPQNETAFSARSGLCVLTLDGQGMGTLSDAADGAKQEFETIARSGSDAGAILYTSGTTGLSKGAVLTQENLLSNTQALEEFWQFTCKDTLLHALPIYHTHGLFVAANLMLVSGGSMIFLPSFNVDQVIERLPHATTMMGVPTFYTRLLADERFDKELCGHMRLFTSGSAPMLLETHIEFERITGTRILERYGMTETGMNTSNPYAEERRVGTVGKPLSGVELRICDAESGLEVAIGEIGIIEVRGPNVFAGYWEKPEKTAEEFRDDGYFITGDLAFQDADGYVTIVGRNKDLIISGGFNVYPKEIEMAIDDCEGVLESAVIGLAHTDFGEAVTAVIVMSAKDVDEAAAELQIRNTIGENLAKFKQPKKYLFVTELTRNTMGKVQKNVLREEHRNLYL